MPWGRLPQAVGAQTRFLLCLLLSWVDVAPYVFASEGEACEGALWGWAGEGEGGEGGAGRLLDAAVVVWLGHLETRVVGVWVAVACWEVVVGWWEGGRRFQGTCAGLLCLRTVCASWVAWGVLADVWEQEWVPVGEEGEVVGAGISGEWVQGAGREVGRRCPGSGVGGAGEGRRRAADPGAPPEGVLGRGWGVVEGWVVALGWCNLGQPCRSARHSRCRFRRRRSFLVARSTGRY